MRVLIVFASSEGHTRRLARMAAAHLADAGHQVSLCDAAQPDCPAPGDFDAVLLAASVHIGRYQAAIRNFARAHHGALNAVPAAFISVSLSAAGGDPRDLAGLRDCLARFERETLWHPSRVHHAAGAMLFSAYDWLTKLAIKFIAWRRGRPANLSQDYDLTDYPALEAFVDGFVAAANGAKPPH